MQSTARIAQLLRLDIDRPARGSSGDAQRKELNSFLVDLHNALLAGKKDLVPLIESAKSIKATLTPETPPDHPDVQWLIKMEPAIDLMKRGLRMINDQIEETKRNRNVLVESLPRLPRIAPELRERDAEVRRIESKRIRMELADALEQMAWPAAGESLTQ